MALGLKILVSGTTFIIETEYSYKYNEDDENPLKFELEWSIVADPAYVTAISDKLMSL
jgi:hypothetical protein